MTLDTAPTFTTDELTQATDVSLDHALTRLYGLHARADDEDRGEVHTGIVAVLAEMSRRVDEWLAGRVTTPPHAPEGATPTHHPS